MIFIRLAGCNLNCRWCDTRYACTEPGQWMDYTEIIRQIGPYPCRTIEFTGGEPLLQKANLIPFQQELIRRGYRLLMETNGSLPVIGSPPELIIIMDVKTPSSGQAGSFMIDNLDSLNKKQDQLKFVIADRQDFDYMIGFIRRCQHQVTEEILVSPVWGIIPPREIAEWIIWSGMNLRLQIQQHKIIWPDQTRGV